ncbi:MAG: hypothetical protein JWL70_2092 [Acidimicrobiia bacterium]|nr:hypothetical protein [Acidimicrobiia bacterium]
MTATVSQIASEIEVAAQQQGGLGPFAAVLPYLADKVDTVHEPAFPSDKVIAGDTLRRSLPVEHEMLDAAMSNRRMDVTVAHNGTDEISMKGYMTGTLRNDGTELKHPVFVKWTVADGQITRIWVDASNPEIQEGYAKQAAAFASPEVKPYLDRLMAIMNEELPG